MEVGKDSLPFIFIGIVIFIGNFLVCMLYHQHNSLQTAANRFVVSFAVCDMMIALLFIPLYIFKSNLSSYVAGLSSFGSILNLLALTYERYVAIFYALRYHDILNSKRIRRLMIAVWVSTLIITLLPLPWELALSSNAFSKWSKVYSGILTAIITIIISITTYVYFKIFKVNRHHMKKEKELARFAVVESRERKSKKASRVIDLLRRQHNKAGKRGLDKKQSPTCRSTLTDICCSGSEVIYQVTDFQGKDASTNDDQMSMHGCAKKSHCKRALNKESIIAKGNRNTENEKKNEEIENNDKSDSHMLGGRDNMTPAVQPGSESVTNSAAESRRNGANSCQKWRVKSVLREIKAARVIAAIFIFNCLCWLPIIVINFCDVMSPKGLATHLPESFITASLYLFVLNSMVNPFIYALFKRDFRKVISRRLRTLRQKLH